MKISCKQLNDALCKLPDPWKSYNNPHIPTTIKVPIYNSDLKFLQGEEVPTTCKIIELTFYLDMKDHQDWVLKDLDL